MWFIILFSGMTLVYIVVGLGLFDSFQKRLSPEALQILEHDSILWYVGAGIGWGLFTGNYWELPFRWFVLVPLLIVMIFIMIATVGWVISLKIDTATREINRQRIANGEASILREAPQPDNPTPAALPDDRIITQPPSDFDYNPARFTAPESGGQ